MIGTAEIIIILFVLFLIGLNICLPLILQKYYPNKWWLGIVLCLFLGGGQLYLPGGIKYVIVLGILYGILETFIGNTTYALIMIALFSVGIINWRFSRIEAKSQQTDIQK